MDGCVKAELSCIKRGADCQRHIHIFNGLTKARPVKLVISFVTDLPQWRFRSNPVDHQLQSQRSQYQNGHQNVDSLVDKYHQIRLKADIFCLLTEGGCLIIFNESPGALQVYKFSQLLVEGRYSFGKLYLYDHEKDQGLKIHKHYQHLMKTFRATFRVRV